MPFMKAEAICKVLGIKPAKFREIIKGENLKGIDGEWDLYEVADAYVASLVRKSLNNFKGPLQ